MGTALLPGCEEVSLIVRAGVPTDSTVLDRLFLSRFCAIHERMLSVVVWLSSVAQVCRVYQRQVLDGQKFFLLYTYTYIFF